MVNLLDGFEGDVLGLFGWLDGYFGMVMVWMLDGVDIRCHSPWDLYFTNICLIIIYDECIWSK